ncbi:ribonuclease inhibitor-like isoform X2 [Colossoma macropomum]|uniref:ribonuclease inhibitor-like isoform X2 n=1 Tax=Colossoma macropomum TaxID=42526 RepID=UPI001864E3D4|nr:ribonuclease inhibitor-like isoform X2 [Colossoma macropomum]
MMLLCVMLLIFSGFMESTSVNFKVVGRAESLVVDAGEDLILPCSLQPNISAVDMMVEWIRTDLSDNRLVHLYKDHKDTNDKQIKSYRGRTALFKTELQKGNTSLKLSGVQASDQGVYQCYIESGSLYDDITVHVEVKGKGFHAWKIAIICILMFAIVLTAFTAYILKDKFSKKQLSPAQCSFIAYMRVQSENMKEDLDLKKFNTSEEGYRRLIPAITNCRKARFAGCNLTALSFETLSTALQTENSSVKELDLSNNDLQDAGVEKLSAGLKSSHCKLEIIRLTVCKLSTQSCYTLQSVLQTETSCLKELDLSNNDLYDSGVEELSAGLKSSHCKLEKLRLAVCKLSAESCNTLQSVLQTETSCLKELDLSNNDLQDAGVEKLSAGLKSSHCKLEIIRLAACKLSAESCNTLQSVLQTETSCLKEIDLSNNDLQDSGVEKLSAALRSLHCKLEILRLAECKLSTQSCNSLHLVLQTQPYCLKELDLSNNDLYDSGVEKLSAGLKSTNCKLQILRLSGCIITEKGCFSLATALSSNPSHLKEVDLTYNHPEKSGVKLLSARREDPQCTLSTLRVEHGGENRIKPGLKKYSCEFTLDPNTVHSSLSLSDGNRKVENVGSSQSYPDHPERFDYYNQVLCRESLTGRCYWEAERSGTGEIAVMYKSIGRKGDSDDCNFGRNVKSWSLSCSDYIYSVCHNNISTDISAPPFSCKRVGVYVDCPAGSLSFYSVSDDKLTHLHTFNTTFTEPLCAGFWVGSDSSVCLK